MNKYIEPNKKLKIVKLCLIVLSLFMSIFCSAYGYAKINSKIDNYEYEKEITLYREYDYEDYDDDSTVCDVLFSYEDNKLIKTYSYDDYLQLDSDSIKAYEYRINSLSICFEDKNPTIKQINETYKQTLADIYMPIFNLSICLFLLTIGLSIVTFYSKFFSSYEKIWFMVVLVLAGIFAVAFPEENTNGVNGILIMLLYLLDTFFNVLCELLISKQSRYNFLVSIAVEIVEIIVCIVLKYRFASMSVTLLFWLPIDVISFISWSKHKDEKQDELTIVRKLRGYQRLLIIIAIIIWTLVVGYLLSGLNITSDLFINNRNLETIIIYIDACVSAVGIANGLFILFRLQEQWIAWYIYSILECIINILSQQYVLIILKLAYLTNTTYGYIKWNKYIRNRDNR